MIDIQTFLTHDLFINGQFSKSTSEHKLNVINPVNEEIVCTYGEATNEEIERAV